MSADRTPDPANPYRTRRVLLNAPAYVLRQMQPNGPWCIVDNASPSRLGLARPLVDGRNPMEAMEESAGQRQRVAERLHPDGHVLFMAVAHSELTEFGIGVEPIPTG